MTQQANGGGGCSLLVAFEVLNRTLVRLRGFLCSKRAEIASASGFGILLAGIEAVLAGFQFSNHGIPRQALMRADSARWPSCR